MRFEASQSMRLGQSMKLAPRVIQSMEILQMPLAELQERIEEELESNVALEQVEAGPEAPSADGATAEPPPDAPLRIDEHGGAEEFARLDRYQSENPDAADNEFAEGSSRSGLTRQTEWSEGGPPRRLDGERDVKMDAMAAAPARGKSLTEQLSEQWGLADVGEPARRLGELLIQSLDADGFLRTPLATVADRAPAGEGPVSVEELGRVLEVLQESLEPAGVAARDLRECLLIQLGRLGEGGLEAEPEARSAATRIVDEHLEDLRQNRLPRIAEKTGLSLDQIGSAVRLIRRLNPAPARSLVEDDNRPIVPDAIIEYDAERDRYVAFLNERTVPNLRINQQYALLSKDRSMEKSGREFLRTNIGNAQWLIDALELRKGTLLRVIGVVIEAQREYFDFGPQFLRPLPMTQVAEQLGIHVATVSRAVAEKYVQTPRGVVPLRRFFSGGLATRSTGEGDSGGEQMAWDAVKAALKEVVEGEDRARPLSDDALVKELKKRGIEIARRTVAKYRDQLGIPTARMRRTFTGA
ncbi:MAG: RNA polymerase factor sigma-54 [Phycisphaerae bacterium]|nr:RNA polymerase factor sigma-54 [Phycisphaerae bacterium]